MGRRTTLGRRWVASQTTVQSGPCARAQVFTNDKAGMEAVDREHVKRVVYEMSKVGALFGGRVGM